MAMIFAAWVSPSAGWNYSNQQHIVFEPKNPNRLFLWILQDFVPPAHQQQAELLHTLAELFSTANLASASLSKLHCGPQKLQLYS